MKVYDRGLGGLGADAAGALARKKPETRTDAGGEQRTVVEGGAYSLSLSGRATQLARTAPAPAASRVDDLKKSYASPSWEMNTSAVAARLIEEG
ncbi:MAG: hypothetical protein HOV80_37580 [Polyangiaceae bacterium]|nr:hypothetical protein [Polyangiaceae bacterium]